MMEDDYLETQVLTASPYRLHLLVVDGAIRHARHARESIEIDDWSVAHLALNNARDFIAELIGGLNPEAEPGLVGQMQQLFIFAYSNLARADFEKDARLVDDALRVLEKHRETWLELGDVLASSPQAAQGTPPVAGGLDLSL